MSFIVRLIGWIGLILFVLAVAVGVMAWQTFQRPFPSADIQPVQRVFDIPRGASPDDVLRRLSAEFGLRQPWLVRWWWRYTGADRKIRSGEVRIDPGWNLRQLTDALIRGERIQHRMTFVPGIRFRQALEKLARRSNLVHRLSPEMTDAQLQKALGWSYPPEGMILPETYFYRRGDSDVSILQRAHRALWRYLERQWPQRAKGLPLKTPYEALILASIVEKETARAEERPLIAGVFVRRLQQGMRLQSDPTTIYGMGERFKGNLTRQDLKERTPYNTYRIGGLPPTPIALPSRAAIDAVLHPAQGDALYFVSKGDGTHYFSRTLQEHNAAVRRFQSKERAMHD